ncbi:class I SAM-dependent DNA methyltransferase [Falsiroseomonas bella]|uniref:site-specific DNA-methyltransferase (adenine-specific) n=1 Tax=Falsiroseomonas bella TaxID=2184016 RepID=A0A317FDC3_9PROT|nr:DNA methyltransferase [Falsiroseomonas bella]PWS36885.1 class I SAM-dependent DNA methyltransferase [Falsiroseomonas bella]
MTPEQFIAKWQGSALREDQASQSHFNDLCALLDEPTPAAADPKGEWFCFERGANKTTGQRGWADVWKRGHFGWEYKGKRKDLRAAFVQLQQYALALENPPLLVVSDMETIIIRTNWTNAVSETHTVTLEELRDPRRRALLKAVLSDPDRLRPERTRQAITEDAAGKFAELAARLRARGHDPQLVAHFVNRIVFCLFADDVGLLPAGVLDSLLATTRKNPARFPDLAGRLFRAMKDPGGTLDFVEIDWFNGGLFDDDTALPLTAQDIAAVQEAARLDWGEIDPTIFGTLFERGLDPEKRGQLGAHYTDREKISLIINPVIIRPLEREWAEARARIEAIMAAVPKSGVAPAEIARRRERARTQATPIYRAFLDRLRAYRVLDPACGSGNFLYLALMAIKDIELRAGLESEALGLQRQLPEVGPEVLLGIELNAYAAELARISVWIGAIQWARRNAMPQPGNPILKPLNTIECRDAVLNPDGSVADWPKADAIVGNPPFIGDKAMIGALGEDYTARLRKAYAGRVPGAADFVCYWFEKAREQIENGATTRAGLVATNSIRGGANRRVLDRITEQGVIFDAWSDEPWTLDGAAVRVSIVCFGDGNSAGSPSLDGYTVTTIFADLSAGDFDLTTAQPLANNRAIASSGVTKKGAFNIDGDLAHAWLAAPSNPNGRSNAEVLSPWYNGEDVTGRHLNRWIINFGDMPETQATFFVQPFAHVVLHVQPARSKSGSPSERRHWWLLARRAPALFQRLDGLARFIATPEVSKHRVFVWLPKAVTPDKNLVAIARDDDTSFGILHSRFHEAWALRLGTSLEDRPRYTPTTTFETFAFPEGLTPNLPAASYAADARAIRIADAARALVAARDRWLNPPEWVEEVPDVLPHLPPRKIPRDAAAAKQLKTRTLTNLYNRRGTGEGAWLDALHADLDRAVAAAYGWPEDIATDDALAALLALNRARTG